MARLVSQVQDIRIPTKAVACNWIRSPYSIGYQNIFWLKNFLFWNFSSKIFEFFSWKFFSRTYVFETPLFHENSQYHIHINTFTWALRRYIYITMTAFIIQYVFWLVMWLWWWWTCPFWGKIQYKINGTKIRIESSFFTEDGGSSRILFQWRRT